MTLLDLVSVLKNNNVMISVKDASTDAEIIAFKSQGYAGVESDVSGRTVRRWEITGSTAITVVLEPAN